MRIAVATLLALLFAAPAHAASLPSTFAPRAQSAGAAGVDVAALGQRFVVANPSGTVTIFPGATPYPVGHAPRAVATGDLNADGRPDVVTANTDSTLSVLLAKADGTFEPATVKALDAPHQAFDVAIGQLTPDAHADVVITTGDPDVAIFPGDGTGALSDPVYSLVADDSIKLAVGDLNRDGEDDLAVTTPAKISVLLQNGTFARNVDYDAAATGIAIGDLDGDGRADLVAGNSVLPGLATAGTFGVAMPLGFAATDLAIGDLNADGKPDVVTTDRVRLNDGRIVELPGDPTHGVAIADADGDGRPDVASANDTGLVLFANTTARSAATAAATTDLRALPVAYTASNAPKLRLYVRAPGANAFALAAEKANPGATGQFDHTVAADGAYAFYTTVVDADGNEESVPGTADATTQVTLKRSLAATSPAFAAQLLGTFADAATRIVNDGEATLTLSAPRIDTPDFAIASDGCTGTRLAPGEECALQIRFSPTAAGARTGRVTLDAGGFDLAGEGVAPVVVPAPPPPPPPAIPLKIPATLGVAVRSTGKTQTRIRALVVNGIPAGSTVVAKLGKRTITKRNVSTRLSLAVLIKQPIKVGTKLTVTVSKPGMVTTVLTLTTRARKNPRITTS